MAAVLAILWGALLIGLVLFTANPVTLNQRQIAEADYVVTATVSDLGRGTAVVENEWKHGTPLRTITVENLDEVTARADREYIIPLTKTGRDRYRVTQTALPGQPPLIYPASEEAREQLERILAEPRVAK